MPIPIPDATRAGLQPYTIELCEKTKEPRHAYVVLEARKYEAKAGPDGKYIRNWTTGLCFMNIQNQPNQAWLLTNYIMNEGMKIIGYGNIPSAASLDARTQKVFQAHDEGGFGSNAYDRMKAHCDTYIDQRKDVNTEILGYKSELEQARRELEALKTATKPAKAAKIEAANAN